MDNYYTINIQDYKTLRKSTIFWENIYIFHRLVVINIVSLVIINIINSLIINTINK